MKKRTLFIGAAGGLLILAILIVVIAQPQRRELSRGANPDGTVTVMIGQKRVFGLMGIEITRQHEDHRGRVLSASVKGECWSWGEARRKFGTAP